MGNSTHTALESTVRLRPVLVRVETQAENGRTQAGRIGGLSRSEAKAAAARLNGKRGGRPRKIAGRGTYAIHQGSVLNILPTLPADSFAGMLSDPPYEIGMMRKGWDSSGIAFNPAFWSEVYRVLMPGAYLLACGSPRTYHRLTCAIEDAGFEIRDCLKWLHGQGFPKSRATLKSAYEPIVLARKPQGNIQPLNIEECRVNPGEMLQGSRGDFSSWRQAEGSEADWTKSDWEPHDRGRYPTNIIIDPTVAKLLRDKANFFYCPKATRKERDAGLESFPLRPSYMVENGSKRNTVVRNPHPCVKPLGLTTWLAKLIRRDGSLLVPFSGSGSEMIGGLQAGWGHVVGIELSPEYVEVAKARIAARVPVSK